MKHISFLDFAAHPIVFAPCILVLLLPLCWVSGCPAADDTSKMKEMGDELKVARQTYLKAAHRLEQNPSDKDPEAWLPVWLDWQKAHRELIKALLGYWRLVEPASSEFNPLYEEFTEMMSEEGVSRGLRTYALWEAWIVLADPSVSKEHAQRLVRFSKPSMALKISNRAHKLGLPVEPLGWDEQLTYALALIRSGNIRSARTQIDLLIEKVKAGGLKGGLDYDPEAGSARYRSKIDYLQTCYLLNALIAKLEGNPALANDWFLKATKLRADQFSPEGSKLLNEIKNPK